MIKKNYIDTGKVRFVSRDMPLKAVHPYAQKAAEAVRCAGDQGKYWELRNAILEIPDLNEAVTLSSVKALGLDVVSFRFCLDSEKYKSAVQMDVTEAISLQIGGTPTFVLARSAKDTLDGFRMEGAQPYPALQLDPDWVI